VAITAELNAMRLAIALSGLGVGSTSPNPPVGCVILDTRGEVVGTGFHRRKGEAHAEALALAAAGERATGGTALVTLEPCNHQGLTPPCHQSLIDAGIVRVVIAVLDPTSRGEGGAARLREAGISVEVGVLTDEAQLVLRPWLRALETRRPHVVWARHVGREETIVPDELLALSGLTSGVDAILRADGSVYEAVPGSHGPGAFSIPEHPKGADATSVLASLFDGGTRSVVLHGGTRLAGPFLDAGQVDEVFAFLASDDAVTGSGLAPAAPGFRLREVRRLPGAVLLVAVPELN